MADGIREGIGRQGLGDMIGGVDGGVGEWKTDRRDRWRQVARNSLAVGMSSSRVNKESNLRSRVLADCYWGTVVSSLSSSEGKKSEDGWFKEVLGGDLGYEGSCQLVLFEVEMVAVYEGMMPVGKLDLLLHSVLGKRQV